jgi:serine/threonine protein kinase
MTLIGQSMGHYHILEQLGEGGMATVYKAYDTHLERDVAIKVIRLDQFPPASLQNVLARFEREAKSLARLTHPNIVNISDYGEQDKVPYLVMEYLPGGTLKGRLGQPMKWQETCKLLLPIAQALDYAHEQNLIHRDVKPSNILMTKKGQPMLTDFGIAKILDAGGQTLTATGVGIGTPEYMAPEQWTGKTTAQSDIYSLGVVMYEMLTGRTPYTADTPVAILLKQANEPLPRPKQYVPDLPEAVEKVLIKAMAKEPADRYQTMDDFASALEGLLSGTTKEEPALPAMAAVAATLTGIETLTPPEPAKTADLKKEAVIEEKETALGALTGNETLQTVNPEVAHPQPGTLPKIDHATPGAPEDKEEGTKLGIPEKAASGVFAKKLLGLPWWIGVGVLVLIALAIYGVMNWKPAKPGTTGMPTANKATALTVPLFFTGTSTGEVDIYSYDGKKVTNYTPSKDGTENWSPASAGQYIYFTANREDGKAEIYRLNNGKVERVTHTPGNAETWSPAVQGNYIYFTSNREDGKAEIYQLNNGKTERVTHTPGNAESWSPSTEGQYVFFTSNREDGKAEIYRLNNGKTERVTHTPGNAESWSPAVQGNYIYFTSNREDGKAEIYRLNNGKTERVTHTAGKAESWSPVVQGNSIFFTSDRSGQDRIYLLGTPIDAVTDFDSWTRMLNDRLPGY